MTLLHLALVAPLTFAPSSPSEPVAFGSPSTDSTALVAKQVAAPASDILDGRVRLPDPAAAATTLQAWIVPVEWNRGPKGTLEAELVLHVDVDGPISFALMADAPFPASSPTSETAEHDAEPLDVRVATPSGPISIADAFAPSRVTLRAESTESDDMHVHGVRFDVEHAGRGQHVLRVRAGAGAPPPHTWWVVRDARDVSASAWTTTFATLSDREIGIAACLQEVDRAASLRGEATPEFAPAPSTRGDTAAQGSAGEAASAAPSFARTYEPRVAARERLTRCGGELFVETPRGTLRVPLFDDGAHEDGAAGDGVVGARLPRWTSGEIRVRAELRGVTRAGEPVRRSVVLQFQAEERRLVLDGRVSARVEDDVRLRVELGARPSGPTARLQVSAEVWGTNANGEWVPVCWLSRMLAPEDLVDANSGAGGPAATWTLPLFLDARWLDVAHARAPFALRNVRVQDPDTHVVHDEADGLPLEIASLPPAAGASGGLVTTSMLSAPATSAALMGPPVPAEITLAGSARPRHLMLVHGYCSSGSIWPAADFSAPKLEFLDPNQNRTHDQFALLLRARMSERNSFGVVGHSQGGPAALHLYTYYVSALDFATGGRRIQSVASPYQGTPLASLGFFACGVNNDMTPAGSTAWLAGIPTWARSEVWYWTTSDAGSACNFLTGILLTNPEDGTVEQSRGQLPGATSMGHVTGWCHTTGMNYPANYTDHARNALMNTNAAR